MIVPPRPEDGMDTLLQRLRRWRAFARGVLLYERLWPALWPALGALGLFVCIALLDLPRMLPGWAHASLLGIAALAVAGLLARGLRGLGLPDARAADRRLEQATGLRHRPLSVLSDRPALPGAEALWRAHVARAAAQIGRLRVGLPRPGLAALDRRALRGGLVVALAACLVIAGEQAPARLLGALHPGFGAVAAPPSAQVQAWITPPAYTGLAPMFLRADTAEASAPAGSHLTVSLTGGSGAPSLSLGGKPVEFNTLDANSFQADLDLAGGGALVVGRGGRVVGRWTLAVVPGEAPVVSFPEPPGMARGRIPQTRLPWQVSHAYGVVSLQAELKLKDRPDAAPVVVPIPLPGGNPKSAKGVRLQDLTAHPWAGLPVTARLVARDAPGNTGTSADAGFDLPERRFQHPVARALMAVRKMLTLKPDDRDSARRELDRMAMLEEVWRDDPAGFLNLRAIASLLHRNRTAPAVDEAQSRMWDLALHLEEGAPERTARALEQARQELREALDAEKRGEPIDKAEIERRMREVQEALQRHLEALAEQHRRDPDAKGFDPEAHPMDTRDMQKLAEEMREAAREGRMDEARDKMAELEKMMEAMKDARQEHGKMTERERQRAEKRQKGQQQMNTLQDIVKREGGLLDRAQGRAEPDSQNERRFSLYPRRDPAPADRADAEAQKAAREAERRIQQALRRVLGELMQQHGDLTGQVPPNLSEADTAMREAGQDLASGRDPAAAQAQQRAIEALQKGGRAMSQQMAQQFGRPGDESGDEEGEGEGQQEGENGMAGNQEGGDQRGGMNNGDSDRRGNRAFGRGRSLDRRADDRRDPLGRQLKEGASGRDESGDVQVPDQMEEARTRAIQEELRRRGGERTRPQPELDYIDRLLRQF
ncbi:MAG TPA: DUF4175 family protein [Acetobacteraceae bacterium]